MRSLLTKAFDALWATPGTDRQIVRKASEPVTQWVRSSPGWPIRYHRSYPKEFAEFLPTVGWADMEETVRRVVTEGDLGTAVLESTLKRLRNGSQLTESWKMLMFTYKMQFESILTSQTP